MLPLMPRAQRLAGTGTLLLALWLLWLAPVAALRLRMEAADPFAHPVLCGHAIDAADTDAPVAPAPTPPGCGRCDLCCCGIAAPLLPAAPRLARSLRWQVAGWPIPLPVPVAPTPRVLGQPRAPPIAV